MVLTTQYATVGTDLGLQGLDLQSNGSLAGLTKVREEVVETFLHLHLSQLIGVPATTLCRAEPWARQTDLIAVDELGRLHVFEVKCENIKKDHIQQQAHYLMGYLFADIGRFLDKCLAKQPLTTGVQLTMLLAGAHAGIQVRKTGVKEVRTWAGPHVGQVAADVFGSCSGISQRGWEKRYEDDQKAELRARAILEHLRLEGCEDVPSWTSLIEIQRKWEAKLGPSNTLPCFLFQPERPLVLWMVGKGLSEGGPDPREKPVSMIHEWRKSGLDARFLGLEVKRHKSRAEWHLRIQREVYPERDAIEQRLLAVGRTAKARPVLRTAFYSEEAPSQQRGTDHGRALGLHAEALWKEGDGSDWRRVRAADPARGEAATPAGPA